MTPRSPVLAAALAMLAVSPSNAAAPLSLVCAEIVLAPDRTPTTGPENKVQVDFGSPARISINGTWGTVDLPASLQRSAYGGTPDAVSLRAAGRAMARMPLRSEMDACMKTAELPAGRPGGGDAETYRAELCRARVQQTAEPVPVDVSLVMTMFQPPAVDSFFIARRYPGDDSSDAEIYGVRSPEWRCKVEGQ